MTPDEVVTCFESIHASIEAMVKIANADKESIRVHQAALVKLITSHNQVVLHAKGLEYRISELEARMIK